MTTRPLLVVVGAGPGIGLAVARRFAVEGFTAGLISRRAGPLGEAAAALTAAGLSVVHRHADAADPVALEEALREIQATAGVPAVLLYNAAHLKWRELLAETAPDLIADFAVNVAGALTAVRTVLPGMRVQGDGLLLFTGSLFDTDPVPAFGSLSIGKAGLRSLAGSLTRSVAGSGVGVHYLSIQGRVAATDPVRSPALIAERCWSLYQDRGQGRGAPGPWEVHI